MTGFFPGPPLTLHVVVVALVCAFCLPLLYDQGLTDWRLPATGFAFILIYSAFAIWWSTRHLKSGKNE
jgi:hypothetical protein